MPRASASRPPPATRLPLGPLRALGRLAGFAAGVAFALLAAASGASPAPAADPGPLPARTVLALDQATFRTAAEDGLAQTQKLWWNPSTGWYRGRLGHPGPSSMWWAFPLLEASAAVAIADPSAANKQRVEDVFAGGERYWDPTLEGSGGVSAGWGVSPSYHAFFDDAGWWGVAYLDAFRATGNRRWLFDAVRALHFIDRFGWDRRDGGVWWDTSHQKKTSEPLAAAMLIASTLYRITGDDTYLATARRYLAWADAHTRNPRQANLYGRNATDGTVMDYVEGMIVAAETELCAGTDDRRYCARAEALADASVTQFPILADWAPETDVVYLRGLLTLYLHDHDRRWYAILHANAQRALAHARDANGLWSRRWDGGATDPGVLYTQAATLELFAWTSSAPPPADPGTAP